MSQKGNLQSIRPFLRSSSLFNLSGSQNLKSLNFVNFFNSFFNKNFIVPINTTFNFVGNKGELTVILFSRSVKILRFSRRLRSLKKNVEHKAWFLFSTLVLDKLKMLGINLISLKIILINKIFSKTKKNRFLQILYLTHRSFRDSVFARRDNLFFDYLKITFLFSKGLVNLEVFLFFLAEIFKFLPKHKHVRFMNLLKKTFAILIDSSLLKKTNSLGGIRFAVAGKLKGKLRKSKTSIQMGKLPVQSISKNVEFAKTHVFTRYGVFGFKLWTFRK